MTDKISGYGRSAVDLGTSRVRDNERAGRSAPPAGNEAAGPHSAPDVVNFTDTATRLQRLEAQLAALPDVDRGRVEALRQQIERGEYRIDAARVADRLVRFDRVLG